MERYRKQKIVLAYERRGSALEKRQAILKKLQHLRIKTTTIRQRV
jgi:hypothetical protein